MSFSSGTVVSSVPYTAALTTMPATLENIGVFCGELVSMFAVRLRTFFCGIGSNGKRERSGIPVRPFGKRFFKRPAGFQPTVKSPHINTMFFGKLCDMDLDTINNNRAFLSLISGLFFRAGPLAICRLIVSIGINALNRHFEWAGSHVGEKVVERVKPTITNNNSAASIVVIPVKIFIVAALFHSAPSYISGLFSFVSHIFFSMGNNMRNYTLEINGVQP